MLQLPMITGEQLFLISNVCNLVSKFLTINDEFYVKWLQKIESQHRPYGQEENAGQTWNF